jgi:hypothetical protein
MNLDLAILGAVTYVTKKWTKQRKAEERHANARRNRAYTFREPRTTIKSAAWAVMKSAYLKASGNGRYPANARQIMYAARPFILEATGNETLNDVYFTQTLLPDFIDEYGLENDWNVAYDARGQLLEPHTRAGADLGTLDVRRYLASGVAETKVVGTRLRSAFPTHGPTNRYGAILFIEKEGFGALLKSARIAERYDVALMSTKGMSVVASRRLVDRLGIPLLVLHDFDGAGFNIIGSFRKSGRRYDYRSSVAVIDGGLRLADIEKYELEPEGQPLSTSDRVLRANGATAEDVAFLHDDGGQRVELNMLTSDQFVELVEARLDELGLGKVVPGPNVLETAYRRAYQVGLMNHALSEATVAAIATAEGIAVPDDLEAQVQAYLVDNPDEPWDVAIASIVGEDAHDEPLDED